MQKVSKGLYLGCIIGGQVLGMILMGIGLVVIIVALAMADPSHFEWSNVNWALAGTGGVFFCLALLVTFAAAVFGYILLYKAWKAIQDGRPRTTPGKAVGYLFIPFFNIYWMFIAYWGWAKDFNSYIAARGLGLPKVSEKLFLSLPILVLCSAVPYLGSLAGIAMIVIYIMMCNAMIDAVNGLCDAPAQPQTTPVVQ